MFSKVDTSIDKWVETTNTSVISLREKWLGRGRAHGTHDDCTVWSEKGNRWLALI